MFAIRGTATAKGELLFPITTRDPDGSSMTYDGQPGTKNQGAIVYAGVVPHLPDQARLPDPGRGRCGGRHRCRRHGRDPRAAPAPAAAAPVEAVPPDA